MWRAATGMRLGMQWISSSAVRVAIAILPALPVACQPPPSPIRVNQMPADPGVAKRGEYLVLAANCIECHTPSGQAAYSGGVAVPTPFGSYYSRNITPDATFGIGAWSDQDFLRALRDGVSPAGDLYFPAFPYTAFSQMTDRDILDIKSYLFTRQAVARPNRPTEVGFPFDWRAVIGVWRALYFNRGPIRADPSRSAEWNRGRYLAEAVVHCGECHTPRDWLGGREDDRRYAGFQLEGSDGFKAPNITTDPAAGIGKWSNRDITAFLKTGITPDGDVVGSRMHEVIQGTAHLTDADRAAIATYLKSVPPLR
jgi:mono/diheme cytochrome c family protein